ncbi:MAG: hypothetical protein IPN03_10000 [Holophagales bacterium]|nr:hypothetical protein [Holophagales bacterium]
MPLLSAWARLADTGVALEPGVEGNAEGVLRAGQLVVGDSFLHDLVELGVEERFDLAGPFAGAGVAETVKRPPYFCPRK